MTSPFPCFRVNREYHVKEKIEKFFFPRQEKKLTEVQCLQIEPSGKGTHIMKI